MATEYPFAIPSEEHINELYTDLKDVWSTRNTFIEQMREMLIGENKIEAPTGTQYKVRTMHTYMLASVVNEKAARYSHLPSLQVIPEFSEDIEAERAKSSELERALQIAQFEMERHGDGDVWSRVIMDAITLDEGVERIERAPAAFWPELTAWKTDKVNNEEDPRFANLFEAPIDEDNYKKLKGIPLRSVYVPLENYLPVLEGGTPVETIEVEERTLRAVMRNKTFNQDAVAKIKGSMGSDAPGIKEKVTILHYCNQKIYAYFALGSTTKTEDGTNTFPSGQPLLLHAYQHNLGQVLYNSVAGRFGGWKNSHNKVEGVSKALVDLNQKADEVMSQVTTNVRARYWPTLLHKVDPDRRGYQAGSPPKAISVPEGQNITIFKDESIEPIFKTEHDEAVPWLMDQIREQMSQLAGSGTLFGGRTPGVETGYHQSLQISQAEHLDEKIEQHVSWGAVMRATLMLKHIKRLGSVFVNYIDENPQGKQGAKYTKIEKSALEPMPRIAAQVRKPRPVDFAAAIRSARDVTDERGGKGALASDDFAREEILGITQPDVEARKILVETQQRKLIDTGVLDIEVQKKMALILAQESAPDITANDASAADPSLNEAISSGSPLTRGQPTGQSQPEASNGTEIANAQPDPVTAPV